MRVEAAARLLERIDDAALAAEVDVVWTVGGNLAQVERYAVAAPVLRRGLRLARNSLQAHLHLHLHVVLAMAELPLLELDAALERLEVAEEATRLQGRRYELAFALTQKARVLAARGRQEEAEQAAFDSELLIGGARAQGATVTLLVHNALVRHARDPQRLLRELEQSGGPEAATAQPHRRRKRAAGRDAGGGRRRAARRRGRVGAPGERDRRPPRHAGDRGAGGPRRGRAAGGARRRGRRRAVGAGSGRGGAAARAAPGAARRRPARRPRPAGRRRARRRRRAPAGGRRHAGRLGAFAERDEAARACAAPAPASRWAPSAPPTPPGASP